MSVCEQSLCNGLSDGALARSGQPVQPVNGGFVKIPRPEFNIVQDGPAGSLEATFAATMAILRLLCATEVVKDSCISYPEPALGRNYRNDKSV